MSPWWLALVLAVVAGTVWPGRPRWPGNAPAAPGDPRRVDSPPADIVVPLKAARRWPLHQRGAAAAAGSEAELAELVALLAAPLRAGVAPPVALAAVQPVLTEGTPFVALVADLRAASVAGEQVAPVWAAHADSDGSADLRFIAQAWALSEDAGAPLADALATVEEVLQAKVRARERLASATAGPRASMAVLCLLPVSGPVVGLAMGLGPGRLYLSSPVATASVGLGAALALLAWWWARRILARAS